MCERIKFDQKNGKNSFFAVQRRAGGGSIRTKWATIILFWPDQMVTSRAFIKKLSGLSQHGFFLLISAERTGKD